MKHYPSEIEVFPYPSGDGWGFLTSDRMVTEETKQKCSHWTLKNPLGDEPVLIDVYWHGPMPSNTERIQINSEIFTFYHRMDV